MISSRCFLSGNCCFYFLAQRLQRGVVKRDVRSRAVPKKNFVASLEWQTRGKYLRVFLPEVTNECPVGAHALPALQIARRKQGWVNAARYNGERFAMCQGLNNNSLGGLVGMEPHEDARTRQQLRVTLGKSMIKGKGQQLAKRTQLRRAMARRGLDEGAS